MQSLRPVIGQFEGNKAELRKYFIERLERLSSESKSDRLNKELCRNLAIMSRILPVLLLFQNSPDEVAKFQYVSLVTSRADQSDSRGDLQQIQEQPEAV